MKNVFKKTFKIIIICFALIFSSCEKDLYEQSIKKTKSSKTEILRGKEAEKVALRIKKILNSQNSLINNEFARTITLDFGSINYDEIVKIIDTYGKENYTLFLSICFFNIFTIFFHCISFFHLFFIIFVLRSLFHHIFLLHCIFFS